MRVPTQVSTRMAESQKMVVGVAVCSCDCINYTANDEGLARESGSRVGTAILTSSEREAHS